MTRDEMLAGLRGILADAVCCGLRDKERDALGAAIAALESSQVEAPPSESVYPFKRVAETWHSKALEWSRENSSLRAELEQARGETVRLRQDLATWQKAAHPDHIAEVIARTERAEQERDAARAKVARLAKVVEAARGYLRRRHGRGPVDAALAELDKEQGDGE